MSAALCSSDEGSVAETVTSRKESLYMGCRNRVPYVDLKSIVCGRKEERAEFLKAGK